MLLQDVDLICVLVQESLSLHYLQNFFPGGCKEHFKLLLATEVFCSWLYNGGRLLIVSYAAKKSIYVLGLHEIGKISDEWVPMVLCGC